VGQIAYVCVPVVRSWASVVTGALVLLEVAVPDTPVTAGTMVNLLLVVVTTVEVLAPMHWLLVPQV
jgi:hypothetical protein